MHSSQPEIIKSSKESKARLEGSLDYSLLLPEPPMVPPVWLSVHVAVVGEGLLTGFLVTRVFVSGKFAILDMKPWRACAERLKNVLSCLISHLSWLKIWWRSSERGFF